MQISLSITRLAKNLQFCQVVTPQNAPSTCLANSNGRVITKGAIYIICAQHFYNTESLTIYLAWVDSEIFKMREGFESIQ